jgi:Dolichyl-phosphate-mannose-protein mannosyltransferase
MRYRLAVGALLALSGGLMLDDARADGVTFDEVYHIPVGYVFLRGGPMFDRGHPMLARYLYALALPRGLDVDRDDPTWGRDGAGYGARFLTRQSVPLMTLVLRARLVVIALALLLAFLVSEAARRRWGPAAGLLSLALCAASPDLIAHGHLATNDLAVSLAIFAAASAIDRFSVAPTFRRALVAALAIALAFLTKFTAMTLAPIALCLLVYRRGRRCVAPFLALGALTFVAVVVLGMASVGFRTGSLGSDLHIVANEHPAAIRAAVEQVAARLHTTPARLYDARIVGYLFFKNLGFLVGRSLAPELFTSGRLYLLGHYSARGWHSYFLVTFLLKTPLPMLAIFVLCAVIRPRGVAPLVIPALVYYAICLAQNANIGQRHLLPMYPFLLAAAGALAADPRRTLRALAWSLAALSLAAVVAEHPYELAFFNHLAGPPEVSWSRLSDSNIDWGQDVPRLAEWQRQNQIGPIVADLHTSLPLSAQGVVTAPRSRFLAVSVTRLLDRQSEGGKEGDEGEKWAWLRAKTPYFRVGRSIFIYRDLP